MLGVPDAYELPPVPGLGYLKPDPTTLMRFKAAYVSGPPATTRPRVRRDEGGHVQGILPFTIAEVQAIEPVDPEPEVEARPAAPQGEERSLLDVAVDHMVGQGPPAHQVWLPPLDVPDTLDELMPDLAEDPELGLVSAALARPGRAGDPARHRRPPARAAPRHPHDQPHRRRRSRHGRRRPAQRQEHAAAHHRHEHVADHDAAGVAVLRARLRRRHVRPARQAAPRRRRRHPLRARRRTPHRGRGDRRGRPSRGLLPGPGHRLHRDLPVPPRGRAAPTTATATCSWSSTAGARCAPTSTTSSSSCSSWPPAASPSACTSSPPAGGWADFRAAMRDVFGTRLELRLGDPVDSEVDRKVAALVPSGPPGTRAGAGQAALPRGAARGSTATPTRPPSATASTTWSSAATPPGTGRAAPSCGCCPS